MGHGLSDIGIIGDDLHRPVPLEVGETAVSHGLIEVIDLVKEYPTHGGKALVLDGISFRIEKGESIALLGINGSGKSTLIRLIAGVEVPTSGKINLSMSMSWPLGFASVFGGNMTGIDNIRFISRVYSVPFDYMFDFVADFSQLGKYLYEPVKTYSTGMHGRLSLGISLAIKFDCYLIDEMIAAGDHRFREKCEALLFDRKDGRSFIMATHQSDLALKYCNKALVLRNGRGKLFEDVDVALDVYKSL